MTFTPKNENLYRGNPGGLTLRDGEDEGDLGGSGTPELNSTTMVGHFAVFNQWTEICSWYEGEFLERVMPGAFKKTIAEGIERVKVQFDHGCNEIVGGNVLGPIDVLTEDDTGAYYEVPLLDTSYNRDIVLPQLQGRLMSGEMRGSVLGASFRFQVIRDEWNMEPTPSTYNPTGLPERTIREVKLFEFGPVVFPAYPAASSGMRSLTDYYLDRLREKRAGTMPPARLAHVTPPDGHLTQGHDPVALQQRATALRLRHTLRKDNHQ